MTKAMQRVLALTAKSKYCLAMYANDEALTSFDLVQLEPFCKDMPFLGEKRFLGVAAIAGGQLQTALADELSDAAMKRLADLVVRRLASRGMN